MWVFCRRLVVSAYEVAQLPADHKNNLATGAHTGKSLIGMALIGISIIPTYVASACRFIDDNALPVVLPAIALFVEDVMGHAQTSFNTTKMVSWIFADPPNAPLQPPLNWPTFT
jgi:hypothetical protein